VSFEVFDAADDDDAAVATTAATAAASAATNTHRFLMPSPFLYETV
jgi:hypothetical protein